MRLFQSPEQEKIKRDIEVKYYNSKELREEFNKRLYMSGSELTDIEKDNLYQSCLNNGITDFWNYFETVNNMMTRANLSNNIKELQCAFDRFVNNPLIQAPQKQKSKRGLKKLRK